MEKFEEFISRLRHYDSLYPPSGENDCQDEALVVEEAWDACEKEYGVKKAYSYYWQWVDSLPEEQRKDYLTHWLGYTKEDSVLPVPNVNG